MGKETGENECLQIQIETSMSPSLAKEAIFLLLSKEFGQNMVYQGYLFRIACEEICDENLPPWEADNKELFTKELDNIWEEPLFLTHLAAYSLCKHIDNGTWLIPITNEFLLSLLKRFHALGTSFAAATAETYAIVPFADQTRFLYVN